MMMCMAFIAVQIVWQVEDRMETIDTTTKKDSVCPSVLQLQYRTRKLIGSDDEPINYLSIGFHSLLLFYFSI